MRESTQQLINFAEILEMIKKRWLFILIVTLIATITTGILSAYVLEPKYLTRAKVFIGKDESTVEGYNSSDIQMYQKLLKTYSETIQTTDLVERAIERSQYNITIESVLKSLNVLPVTDTQILEVEYESEDPAEAKGIVERDVIQIITPGARMDLATDENNYIVCLDETDLNYVLAFADISTGEVSELCTRSLPAMAGNEAEGLTIYPMEDGSLFHILDYDKTVGVYVRHYKLAE